MRNEATREKETEMGTQEIDETAEATRLSALTTEAILRNTIRERERETTKAKTDTSRLQEEVYKLKDALKAVGFVARYNMGVETNEAKKAATEARIATTTSDVTQGLMATQQHLGQEAAYKTMLAAIRDAAAAVGVDV